MATESRSQNPLCDEVLDDLARVLDGTAPTELFDHIADCDTCRDLRHDAQRALATAKDAGADYVAPGDLAERVLRAVDARGEGPKTERLEKDAPKTERIAKAEPEKAEPEKDAPKDSPARKAEKKPEASLPETRDPAKETKEDGGTVLPFPRKWTVAVVLVAAAAAAALVMTKSKDKKDGDTVAESAPWSGRVVALARASAGKTGGLSRCDAGGTSCVPVGPSTEITRGSVLRTDEVTRAELEMADGSKLVLDRDTEVALDAKKDRTAEVVKGALVADVAHLASGKARFKVPGGNVEVLGTKLAIYGEKDGSRVEVSRGVVAVTDASGASEKVYAGEESRFGAGRKLSIGPSTTIGDTATWTERSFKPADKDDGDEPLRGLGELKAKKPGTQDERAGAVKLAKHEVRVRISDSVARTEIEEVFDNSTGEELEGIFRFPLPPDAQIERLALEVNGKLEEGAFVEKEKAAAIWRGVIQNAAPRAPKPVEEIIWVPGPWRDPALLEWKRGGRFELRIFPIPARGSRRLILAYTQTVQPTGGVRRYTYPLPYDAKGTTEVASFKLDAQVVGNDKAYGVRARGYDVNAKDAGVTLEKTNFTPTGDLTLEYALTNPTAEVNTYAYTAAGDDSPYALIQLRPQLPKVRVTEERDHVVVLDTSRSMVGERLARARNVVSAMVREMNDGDRVLVMACDSTCRPWGEGMAETGKRATEAAATFVKGQRADGASDVAAMIAKGAAEGAKSSSKGRKVFVTYVGDGAASVGPTKPDHMTLAVRRALTKDGVTVNAVAIGQDADATLLAAVARGGGGVLVPFVPGQGTTAVALAALSASYGARLEQPELTLPAGFVAVAPTNLDSLRAGGEALVVARMTSKEIEGEATLRGKVAGEPFEKKLPIKVVASTDAGNAFVPRQYAALRIAELERSGGGDAKAQIVDLSKKFAVASRHTSLLVLESEAMMNAFGLKRQSAVPAWTGEQAAIGTATSKNADPEPQPDAPFAKEEAERARDESFGDSRGAGAGGIAAPKAASRGPRTMGMDGDFAAPPPPAAAPPMKPAPTATMAPPPADAEKKKDKAPMVLDDDGFSRNRRGRPSGRPMIPMRKVWDRKATVVQDLGAWHDKDGAKVATAETKLTEKPDSRNLTKELFGLYAQHGRGERAAELAEKWAQKDAMDVDALVARADVAARSADRDTALRILGGVVDMRPDDTSAQQRMARLFDLMGDKDRACAHRVALAEQRGDDLAAQADAVRCARATGQTDLGDRLMSEVASDKRSQVEAMLTKSPADPTALVGDVRLEGSFSGGDVDLALVDKNGVRLSWTGGGKAPVTATGVTSPSSESVAFSNLGQGGYVVEVTRAVPGNETIRGTVTVRAAGETRSIPFTLTGTRMEIGKVDIFYTSRLVPM